MKKLISVIALSVLSLSVNAGWGTDTASTIESKGVNRQQKQFAKVQPVPFFDWSLERHLVIQLYQLRNLKAATHVVWRGDTSVVEGDCAAIGYGIPYDTSLTNPMTATDEDNYGARNNALASIGQAEPNGLYASTNTAATWVMCVNEQGLIEPIYTESKVTGYPYPVKVDYNTNRVIKAGKASVTLRLK